MVTDTKIPMEIIEQAIDYSLQYDNPEVQQRCRHWIAQDPLHLMAWQRVDCINQELDQLNQLNAPRGLFQHDKLSRRQLLSLLAVGIGLGAIHAGWRYYHANPYQTTLAEVRGFELDFAAILLNAQSSVTLTPGGQVAQLTVARGDILLTALKACQVALTNSVVSLGKDSKIWLSPTHVMLIAGTARDQQRQSLQPQVNYKTTTTGSLVQAPLPFQPTAWVEGELVADKMPVGELLAYFERYHSSILSASDDIGRRKVSGVFQLNDLESSMTALAKSLGLNYRRLSRLFYRFG